MRITNTMLKGASAALGREVTWATLNEAMEVYGSWDLGDLKVELEQLQDHFRRSGGRGVETADSIDMARSVIAAREADEASVPAERLATIDWYFEKAEQHGEATEPENMEVGDLQDLLLECWEAMSDSQKRDVLDTPRVRDVLTGPEFDGLPDEDE